MGLSGSVAVSDGDGMLGSAARKQAGFFIKYSARGKDDMGRKILTQTHSDLSSSHFSGHLVSFHRSWHETGGVSCRTHFES